MRKILRKLPPVPKVPPAPSSVALAPEPTPEVQQAIDWDTAVPDFAFGKRMVSIRLDAEVLDYFQAQGRGYQTRINAVLRAYMKVRQDQG